MILIDLTTPLNNADQGETFNFKSFTYKKVFQIVVDKGKSVCYTK